MRWTISYEAFNIDITRKLHWLSAPYLLPQDHNTSFHLPGDNIDDNNGPRPAISSSVTDGFSSYEDETTWTSTTPTAFKYFAMTILSLLFLRP